MENDDDVFEGAGCCKVVCLMLFGWLVVAVATVLATFIF